MPTHMVRHEAEPPEESKTKYRLYVCSLGSVKLETTFFGYIFKYGIKDTFIYSLEIAVNIT